MTGLQKSEVMKVDCPKNLCRKKKKKTSEDSSTKNRPEVEYINGVQQMIWILVSGMTTP